MMIDQFPRFIAERSTLKDRLTASLMARGFSADAIAAYVTAIPAPLVDAGAFLDSRTGLWRYEFGGPIELDDQLLFGVHMWLPVDELCEALHTLLTRVPEEKRGAYLARMADASKHWAALAEMMPGARLSAVADADFEVPGAGGGNKAVDWSVTFKGRRMIFDVKSRILDLIEQAIRSDERGLMPEPEHDPARLFKSLAEKFRSQDPETILQGAWITTRIKQERTRLQQAFDELPADKIHFAIFGDWGNDVHLLVRRQQDIEFLLDVFTAVQSTRFIYEK